jgi:response regulator RpfG family c-di-GMP phosphodiesterase
MERTLRVLFLEDTDIWINTYKRLLTHHLDCEIQHFANGEKAVPFINDVKFDVIICDHFMPGWLGSKVYDYARNNKESKNKTTPFIHHSSMPCPEEYKGSEDDLHFINTPKDGDFYNLYYDLLDCGYKAKEELKPSEL